MKTCLEDMAEEGITPATAKAAIERLEEMGQVGRVGWDRIVTAASVQTPEPARLNETCMRSWWRRSILEAPSS